MRVAVVGWLLIGWWVCADSVVALPAFVWSSLVGSVVEDKKAAEFGKAAAKFRWRCSFVKLIRMHPSHNVFALLFCTSRVCHYIDDLFSIPIVQCSDQAPLIFFIWFWPGVIIRGVERRYLAMPERCLSNAALKLDL